MNSLIAISFSNPSWDAIHEATQGFYIEHESLYKALDGVFGTLALDHVHLSCMATTDFGLEIAQRTPLRCAGKGQLWIFSGTLNDWKRACLEICQTKSDINLRRMFNKVVLFFDTQRVFAFREYDRHRVGDSFVLKEKKP